MSASREQHAPRHDPVPCWQAKPCPFCGWVPSIQSWHGGAPTKMMIACDYDGCHVAPMVTGETRAAALRHWNRRVPRSDRVAKKQDNARCVALEAPRVATEWWKGGASPEEIRATAGRLLAFVTKHTHETADEMPLLHDVHVLVANARAPRA